MIHGIGFRALQNPDCDVTLYPKGEKENFSDFSEQYNFENHKLGLDLASNQSQTNRGHLGFTALESKPIILGLPFAYLARFLARKFNNGKVEKACKIQSSDLLLKSSIVQTRKSEPLPSLDCSSNQILTSEFADLNNPDPSVFLSQAKAKKMANKEKNNEPHI